MAAGVRGTEVAAYTIPTERPESDGTLEWSSTTLIVVHVSAGDATGLGLTYGNAAVRDLVERSLFPVIEGADPMSPPRTYDSLVHVARNWGRSGLVAMAISAVDLALWDLKARTLGVPLVHLLGRVRDRVPAYWSGGFTSETDAELADEFGAARRAGFTRFKMKVGRDLDRDPDRVAAARHTVGPAAGLFVDANGACSVEQALGLAARFQTQGVTWFEEPVPWWDLAGTARVVAGLPEGMAVATGEYAAEPSDVAKILQQGAAGILQADATRCGGVTGFLRAAALASAWNIPFSSHTAPSIHATLDAVTPAPFHSLEFFKDHARIEAELFDGAVEPKEGGLAPSDARPGFGLSLRRTAAADYQVGG
jgi:L-alanine-DL-glutamate epimerase-like enolase superfamily enzyme